MDTEGSQQKEYLMNRGILADGGLQDMECPVGMISKINAESSSETECSMDIVDLVYAKGLGNTCGCTVDIVSGLVDTHSHMHVSAHTHTHTHSMTTTS